MPSSPRLRTTSFLGNFLGAIFAGSAMCLISWSEWRDLNLRPPRPERGALPRWATLALRSARGNNLLTQKCNTSESLGIAFLGITGVQPCHDECRAGPGDLHRTISGVSA